MNNFQFADSSQLLLLQNGEVDRLRAQLVKRGWCRQRQPGVATRTGDAGTRSLALNYRNTSTSCTGTPGTIERVRPSVMAKEAIYG